MSNLQGARRPIVAALALAVVLAVMAFWPVGPEAQAPPAGRIRVLFLGDNDHHRPYARAKEVLPALARRGVDLFYSDDPADLNAERLADYHVLLLYNNHPRVTDAQFHALSEFVANGGGLVAVHSASASFQNSEAFIKLVGAAFKSHGTGTFSAVRTAENHPAIAGVPSFESWDETYVHTKHNPVNRTVLEVRREGDHEEPWTWVRTHGRGRVFYTAWGHDQRTWTNEGFQQLLGQGIRWSAGDGALQASSEPVPGTTRLAVPLPVYQRPPAPWNTLVDPVWEAQEPLPPEESLQLATLRPGFSMEVFAAEPLIRRIIDFTWDARGRMWAVEANDYPNRVLPEGEPGGDRVLILEDSNGDGRADNAQVFAEGLNLATSLVLINGGVVVAQAPQMLFLRDTNGDGRADERTVLSEGWPRNDTHGTPSNLRYGLDNQVLGSVGYNGFRGTVGGRTWGRGEFGAGYYRFPADGSTLEYLARTSNNTWGVALSEDGHIFGSTANNRPSNFVHIPARYYHALGEREPTLPGIEDRADIYALRADILQVDQFGLYTSGAAHELYTARAFPREYWNRKAFVTDPTGQLVGMFDLRRDGSAYRAINQWNFLASRDAWVAPVQVKVGPDGALWVSDFYTLVSQHNPTPNYPDKSCCPHGEGNAYETPNRDATRARIYRVSYDEAPRYTPMRLDTATPAQLVAALRHDNMFWRLTAQRLLVERGQRDVVPDLVGLLGDHTMDELGLNPGALHALWTLDGLDAIDADERARQAVRNALHHPAPSVRRAALMVLPRTPQLADDIFAAGMLPDRTAPGQMDYTVASAVLQDADPTVRLEALLVLSELPASPRAAAAVSEGLRVPANARDRWLPDALAMAGARQGPAFLQENLKRGFPANDRDAVAGVARAVRRMVRFHATSADAALAVSLIEAVSGADSAIATALVDGLTEGWPEDRPPTFSPTQRTALAGAARQAGGDLAGAFAKLGERWGIGLFAVN